MPRLTVVVVVVEPDEQTVGTYRHFGILPKTDRPIELVLVQRLQGTVGFVDPEDPEIVGRSVPPFLVHANHVDVSMMKDARSTLIVAVDRWRLAAPLTVRVRTLRMKDERRRAELRTLEDLHGRKCESAGSNGTAELTGVASKMSKDFCGTSEELDVLRLLNEF